MYIPRYIHGNLMAYDGMRNFGLFSQWFVSDLQIGEVGGRS